MYINTIQFINNEIRIKNDENEITLSNQGFYISISEVEALQIANALINAVKSGIMSTVNLEADE